MTQITDLICETLTRIAATPMLVRSKSQQTIALAVKSLARRAATEPVAEGIDFSPMNDQAFTGDSLSAANYLRSLHIVNSMNGYKLIPFAYSVDLGKVEKSIRRRVAIGELV